MQVFMRNISYTANEHDCKVALAPLLHRPPFPSDRPINFDIRLFSKRGNQGHTGCGLLTLPTTDVANTFLRTYGRGVSIRSRVVAFCPSIKQPDQGLIKRVADTDWVDPQILQERRRHMESISGSISLSSFSFGRLCHDGTFSVELEGLRHTNRISCDAVNRQIRITSHMSQSDVADTLSIWFRASQVVALACPPSSTNDGVHHIFLEATQPPVLEIQKTSPPPQRVSSFNDSPVIPATRFMLLSFDNPGDMNTFLARARNLHIRGPLALDIPIARKNLYSPSSLEQIDSPSPLEQIDHLLSTLPYRLAFEADKAIASSILDPEELLGLGPAITQLQDDHREEAGPILRRFVSSIHIPSLMTWEPTVIKVDNRSRKRRRRGGRRNKKKRPQDPPPPSNTLDDLLRSITTEYLDEVQLPRRRFAILPSDALFDSYTLVLTPLSRILEGPLLDQSNSVLRRFGHHDCFLRLSFQDENRTPLRRDPTSGTSIAELLRTRFRSVMVDGIRIAGRDFQFLGYSMSGLKDHSIMLMRDFYDERGELMTAEGIRRTLGSFNHISNKPALLAARWSQAFSASDPSVTLDPNEIRRIDDRRSASGSLFTDGCGTISPLLARDVWKFLQQRRRRAVKMRSVPSCFQIRIGGAKGVLFQDPTLAGLGRVVCLRPSQTKFENPEALTLDIASTSARPIRMFLNRPLILLLEFLGVQDDVFLSLQKDATAAVERARDSFTDAAKLFSHHGFGSSFRLASLFKNFKSELKLDDSDLQELGCQLITRSVEYAATHVLREIKFRARIPVHGSWTLLGVSDEWSCLREGEIYATVRDERTGTYVPIEGRVLITRSPQIHPGDVQFVNAVRHPKLEHLNNVVVFSCEGDRSLPSMLGGGDLDGDIYNLILDPNLFPIRTSVAGAYEPLPHKVTPHACTIEDIADFVIDYIEADLVGYISILHLRIADLDPKGPSCDECLLLAEKASHAVDFQKTGTPVNFDNLPRAGRLRPDFLAGEVVEPSAESSFYPSDKVLGILYRNVPLKNEDAIHEESVFGIKIWESVTRVARRAEVRFGLPSINDHPDELLDEMHATMMAYSEQLMEIAKAHTQSRIPGDYLTEPELVSGTIQGKWHDHRKRRETVVSMELQTRELSKSIRQEFRRPLLIDEPARENIQGSVADTEQDDEDDEDEEDEDELSEMDLDTYIRASAAWQVANDALADDVEAFGPSSFGLIALGVMLQIMKKARKLSQ